MPETGAATQKALAPISVNAIAPKDLLERFDELYGEIANRAFSIFENEGRILGRDVEHWLKAESELLHPVHLDVTEQDGAVNIQAEVPGFEAKDLEVTLEPQRLIISGKRETKEEAATGKIIHKEQCSKEILRAVRLPFEVDASKATATLKNGVLELHAPKIATATSTQVEVKGA